MYLSFDGRLMAVDVDATGDSLRIGASRIVSWTTAAVSQRSADLISDTDRLIVINQRAQAQTPLTTVVGLRRLLAGSTGR